MNRIRLRRGGWSGHAGPGAAKPTRRSPGDSGRGLALWRTRQPFCVWTRGETLQVVAGGCWFGGFFHTLWSGQTRMPPRQERRHEEVFGLGDCFTRWTGSRLRRHVVDHRSGQTRRMPPQERRHEEVFGLGDCFTRSGAASHAVPPRERQH